MAATADVPDELMAWWRTFNNGVIVDEEEEDSNSEGEEEPDDDREDVEVGEEDASAATASEVAEQITADASRPEKECSGGGGALHGDEEIPEEDGYVWQLQVGLLERKREAGEEIPEGSSVQLQGEPAGRTRETIMTRSKLRVTGIQNHNQKENKVSEAEGGLRGRKRKATVTPSKLKTTGIEIQDKKCHGECLRAENEMLRRQLMRKTKELEAEQIGRLKLKMSAKNKEIKALKKQIGESRADNGQYMKTAKLPKKTKAVQFL